MSRESEFFSNKIFVKNFAYDNKFEFLLKSYAFIIYNT